MQAPSAPRVSESGFGHILEHFIPSPTWPSFGEDRLMSANCELKIAVEGPLISPVHSASGHPIKRRRPITVENGTSPDFHRLKSNQSAVASV